MAFDIHEFFKAARTDETTTVCHGTETFKIKRLNGVERLRFTDLEKAYDKTVYVLARCVLTGVADRPIGEENAVKFIERFPMLGDALYKDIINFTEESLEQEAKIWADSKKNSPTSPGTKTADADIVAGTV